jgi:hypothetical protein
LQKLLRERRLRLPNHPRLLAQLRAIVCQPLSGGGYRISSPRRAGAHGDLVSALVNAIWSSNRKATAPKANWAELRRMQAMVPPPRFAGTGQARDSGQQVGGVSMPMANVPGGTFTILDVGGGKRRSGW